jgi:hypothetical protein
LEAEAFSQTSGKYTIYSTLISSYGYLDSDAHKYIFFSAPPQQSFSLPSATRHPIPVPNQS